MLRNRTEVAQIGNSQTFDKVLAYLHPTNGLPGLSSIPINRPRFIVGREISAGCNYAIPQNYISSQHFSIKKTNDKFVIVDLDSSNGTRLNGIRLKPQTDYIIVNGDNITLSDNIVFDFQISDDSVPSDTPPLTIISPSSPVEEKDLTHVDDAVFVEEVDTRPIRRLPDDSSEMRKAIGLRTQTATTEVVQDDPVPIHSDLSTVTNIQELEGSPHENRIAPDFDELDIDWNS